MAKIYRVSESARTLRRWDKNGSLVTKRLPLGHRYYDESDIRKLFPALIQNQSTQSFTAKSQVWD